MINQAIRYQPILRVLARHEPQCLLEVGSGPEGLALFWPGDVIGVDVAFKRQPLHRAVQASALALPFETERWSITVCCDLLEHLQPDLRPLAVDELLRVTKDMLLLAFPSGEAATRCYAELTTVLAPVAPQWLNEHVLYGLPDARGVRVQVEAAGWHVTEYWYEHAITHQRLLRWEYAGLLRYFSYGIARLFGPRLPALLPAVPGGERSDDFLRVLLVAVR